MSLKVQSRYLEYKKYFSYLNLILQSTELGQVSFVGFEGIERTLADHTIESQVVQTTSCLCSKDLLLGFIQCVFDFESLFS